MDKILTIIKAIESKNSEMQNFLSDITISSRKDLLKEIIEKIITNNEIFQEILSSEDKTQISEISEKVNPIIAVVDNLVSNIKMYPSKRIIYLLHEDFFYN